VCCQEWIRRRETGRACDSCACAAVDVGLDARMHLWDRTPVDLGVVCALRAGCS